MVKSLRCKFTFNVMTRKTHFGRKHNSVDRMKLICLLLDWSYSPNWKIWHGKWSRKNIEITLKVKSDIVNVQRIRKKLNFRWDCILFVAFNFVAVFDVVSYILIQLLVVYTSYCKRISQVEWTDFQILLITRSHCSSTKNPSSIIWFKIDSLSRR